MFSFSANNSEYTLASETKQIPLCSVHQDASFDMQHDPFGPLDLDLDLRSNFILTSGCQYFDAARREEHIGAKIIVLSSLDDKLCAMKNFKGQILTLTSGCQKGHISTRLEARNTMVQELLFYC
jgi:hypothetical protein